MGAFTSYAIVGSALLSAYQSSKNRSAANRQANRANALAEENMRMQNEIMNEQLEFQEEQAAKLEAQKDIYRDMDFINPYENVKNQFTMMENVYEDMTVDMRAAEFQAEQGAQARANILSQLRGVAGTSGIAGLAQTLANQAQLQARQISVDISRQERQIQGLQRQEASRLQELERRGAGQAEMTRLGGVAALQEMEMSRQATLLGIQMGQTSGANQAVQQAYANQMAAGAQQANLYGQQAANLYGLAGDQMSASMNMLNTYAMMQ